MKSGARMYIESHVPFRELANAEGATWLDRKLLAKKPEAFREKGFGAEANRALKQRQRWLRQEGLMTEQDGRLVVQRRMLEELTRRNVTKVGSDLSKKHNLSHVGHPKLGNSNTKITRTIRMASGRFAMMQKGKQFALVPWRQAMQMRKAKGLGIEVGRGI